MNIATGTTGFVHDAIAGRVVFGSGSRSTIADEVALLGASRVVVIASTFEDALASDISERLGSSYVGRFSDVVQHVPVAKAADAIALVNELEADGVVTIGGGSATGFGKAVALDVDIATVAVPTTYAGSEMTTIWGMTDGDHKQTGKNPRVKPNTVIYDPELTVGLPSAIAGPSGMNALAHCVEALYGPGANPITSLVALEGVRVLANALPRVCSDNDGIDARSDALYGAYLGGVALASGGTALHHKTCHVLGGMFGLNHGDMNSVMLGHALAYTAPAIPSIITNLATSMSVDDPATAMFDLSVAMGSPTALADIGMPEDGLDEAARRTVTQAAANINPPIEAGIRAMLDDAYHGRTPRITK